MFQKMPTLHLSDWLPWDQHRDLPSSAGVYLIAKKGPSEIIYIGGTCCVGGLRKRVMTFNNAALKGKDNHSGGCTYHGTYGSQVDDLFVCFHDPKGTSPDPKIISAYVQYAERRLIWEYVVRHGRLPECNKE